MADESRSQCADKECPFCAFWSAYRKSEASEHVRAIQRETLLLVRSVLDGCIKAAEEQVAAHRAAGDSPREEPPSRA
jgi:hypothetical protein